ncbi:MAG: methionine--tRNA ligase [Desulfobacterota bacterium]|nr:methionine--tRNA ligase [Thermodesulfobacteriota bacterium]
MNPVYYVTTPIYYVNAEPHIGHLYSTLVADTLNRFYQSLGYATRFQTGTDEHGEKVVQAAQKEGKDAKAYADRVSRLFREAWPELNIRPDRFIRTTDEAHIRVVTQILQRVYDSGDIYFSEYGGHYCVGCERFYVDRELVDGCCPDHKQELHYVKEANYFFRMSAYQDWLIGYIRENSDFIRPERYRNEVLSFLSEPLEDLCISRPKSRLTWGITLPFDDRYVTYVWFDALINYLSGLGYPDDALYSRFWPAAEHIIAKDILKPHGIYWPTMLKAAGIEPYRHLNVHGYWNLEQSKISKSLGNVIRPRDLKDKYGVDAVRYFFLREMVFGLDAHFSEEGLIQRINADLANNLGNCFSRTLTMIARYSGGLVPVPGETGAEEEALKDLLARCAREVRQEVQKFALHKALMSLWEVIDGANKYIDAQAPWTLAKDPGKADRLQTVLYFLAETLRQVALLLAPFLPQTAEQMLTRLGLQYDAPVPQWDRVLDWGGLPPGSPVEVGPALFPRIEVKKEVPAATPPPKKQVEAAPQAPAAPSPVPPQTGLPIEAFQQWDLRVARVLSAERVPKSKKLIRMEIDLGEQRTLVAGIGQDYSPEEMVGKHIVVVANLQPTKLMGVESQAMLLAANDGEHLKIVVPEGEMPPGAKVK